MQLACAIRPITIPFHAQYFGHVLVDRTVKTVENIVDHLLRLNVARASDDTIVDMSGK